MHGVRTARATSYGSGAQSWGIGGRSLDDAEDGAVGGGQYDEVRVRWVGPVLDAGGAQRDQAVHLGVEGRGGAVDPEIQVGAVGFVEVEAGGGAGLRDEEVGVVGEASYPKACFQNSAARPRSLVFSTIAPSVRPTFPLLSFMCWPGRSVTHQLLFHHDELELDPARNGSSDAHLTACALSFGMRSVCGRMGVWG